MGDDILSALSRIEEIASQVDIYCVALYEAGLTMAEIGKRLGVSQERVRQRLRRAETRGVLVTRGRHRGAHWTDPRAVLSLVRSDPGVTSWAEVARRLRRARSAVRRAVAAAGLFEPINRLLRLRRRSRRVWSQQRVLVEVARIAAAHERAPSTAYLMRHYPALAAAIYKFFESYHDVCESLGLEPRRGRNRTGQRSTRQGGGHRPPSSGDARGPAAPIAGRQLYGWPGETLATPGTHPSRPKRRGPGQGPGTRHR
jgi:DNA-binding CsgD family transcriptional regulator